MEKIKKVMMQHKPLVIIAAVSLIVIICCNILNGSFFLSPQEKVALAFKNTFCEAAGCHGSFDVHFSDLSEENEANILQAAFNELHAEGVLDYNLEQKLFSVDGNANVAGYEIMKLDFYGSLKDLDVKGVKTFDWKEFADKIDNVTKTKVKTHVQTGKLSIPEYVDCYSFEIPLEVLSQFPSVEELIQLMGEEPDAITTKVDFFVDKNCYLRNVEIEITKDTVSINANIAIDEIKTKTMPKIKTEGRTNITQLF